jgi:hypothetical protein
MSSGAVPESLVLQIARTLEAIQTTYAFMGGVAVNAWGVPRATFDIDFVIGVDPAAFAGVLQGLATHGVEIDEPFTRGYRDTLHGMEKVNASWAGDRGWVRLDIFRTNTPFLESAMSRRVLYPVRDGEVYVVTAADLILFKLLAGRRKDWVDIDNVVAVQGIPERGYLERWAKQLEIEARLLKVLQTG